FPVPEPPFVARGRQKPCGVPWPAWRGASCGFGGTAPEVRAGSHHRASDGRGGGTSSPEIVRRVRWRPPQGQASGGREVASRGLAGAAVRLELVGDLLAFIQTAQAGALHGADVDENVLAAVIRLNETITLLLVEPLHGAGAHFVVSFVFR